jgi:putative ABC transport system substrate-binding protein
MIRRAFITLLGGAAAGWPLAARAQQPAMPMIGYLDASTASERSQVLAVFRQGLSDAGYVEGQNVTIEFRWADGDYRRLPQLAADLVRRKVGVIVTPGTTAAALAAKATTDTIPIVFGVGQDPVKLHLVASLARPGGNATGVNFFSNELVAKRLALLRELVPAATRVAMLVNPANQSVETTVKDVETAARAMGLQIQILNTTSSREITAAFATFVRERPDALFVAGDSLFTTRRVQLATLAVRHALPAIYSAREYCEVGGLMSYGSSPTDAHRQAGVYTGRILKGAKPADLPVVQASKFELVINAETARILGLTVPPTLLATADEVIE